MGVTVLIGAAMLGCLLLWVWPHWRDLERLKETARRLGQGQMAERTHISPHSNIGELAGVFDTMASDLERHVNQQRELLNAVSHELRTPLTRLDFGLVLLFDEVPPASRKRLLELVGHVRELDELVLELLSYSRLYNADQARERVEVSLLELVDSVLGGFAEELDGRGIRWEVQAEGNLPRFVLDPRLTARAVQNLVRNAMRYCDESLLLRLRLEGDGACLLTVEDDGIGIPVEERERIFQPFYRLDRSRDRNTGGFGLGLAISRRAIEGQGGTLTVAQSALGVRSSGFGCQPGSPQHKPVLARVLGFIQRLVGLDQCHGQCIARAHLRQADTDGYRMCACIFTHSAYQCLYLLFSTLLVQPLKKNGKFLTAQSGKPGTGHGRLDVQCHASEHFITHVVAKTVIDLLEVVYVDHRQILPGRRSFQLLLCFGHERAAVGISVRAST